MEDRRHEAIPILPVKCFDHWKLCEPLRNLMKIALHRKYFITPGKCSGQQLTIIFPNLPEELCLIVEIGAFAIALARYSPDGAQSELQFASTR